MNPFVIMCFVIAGEARQDEFILNVPDIFKDNNLLLTKSVTATASTESQPGQFYNAPPISTPSSFYEVPDLTVSESPPPFPSDDNISTDFNDEEAASGSSSAAASNNNNLNSASVGTILSRPSAVATDDRLLIVPSAQISLPLISTSSSASTSSSSSNKVTSTALSGGMALLVAFLLSLIPTLAISIPFFALTRRRRRIPVTLVTGGRSLVSDDEQMLLLDKLF